MPLLLLGLSALSTAIAVNVATAFEILRRLRRLLDLLPVHVVVALLVGMRSSHFSTSLVEGVTL